MGTDRLGEGKSLRGRRGSRSSSRPPLPFLQVALCEFTSPLLVRQVSRLESFWALRVVCSEQLTALLAWIQEPWEQLFSIGLRTVTQEALDLDR